MEGNVKWSPKRFLCVWLRGQ